MENITKKRASGKKKRNIKTANDYSNDPFFIEKREMSLKVLRKSGLPDALNNKKK